MMVESLIPLVYVYTLYLIQMNNPAMNAKANIGSALFVMSLSLNSKFKFEFYDRRYDL